MTRSLSEAKTLKKIFTLEIVNQIIRFTNQKAEACYYEWNNTHPDKQPKIWDNVTSTEIYAYIGILIGAAENNSNTDHTFEMWKTS